MKTLKIIFALIFISLLGYSQDNNKRINELPSKTTGFRRALIPGLNPVSNITEAATIQEYIGGERASFDWQVTTAYVVDDLVFSSNKVWRCLVNNTGVKPSEGITWTEETISTADGITDTPWEAGVFTIDNSKVVVNNIQYYLQTAAPFKSANFATELLAGDWDTAQDPVDDQVVSSSGTLSLDSTLKRFIFSGTTTTWTMFALTGNTGKEIVIYNRGSGSITLNSNGGANDFYNAGTPANSLTITANSVVRIYCDGTYFIND